MVWALRTSQDPERMDLVRENQLRGCPSISPQRTWKIWQPNWGCRPDRLNTFRFERKILSCQSGTSQAAGRRAILWAVELATSYVWTAGLPSPSLRQFSKNFRIARRVSIVARRKKDGEKSVL